MNYRLFISEFIGTFALVFFGAGAVLADEFSGGALGNVGIAAVFGAVVSGVIYALGPISGAHINPAVSIAFALSGKFAWRKVPWYAAAQFLGAALASFLLSVILPSVETFGQTQPHTGIWPTFLLEFIFTFFLMLVIIFVSTGSKEQGLMAGLAIGLTVFLEAAMGGPLTGASMNPARSFGPDVAAGDFSNLWIYFFAPVLGAAFSILIWRVLKTPIP